MLRWKKLDELVKGDLLVDIVDHKVIVVGLFEFITDLGSRILYLDTLDEVYKTTSAEGVTRFSVIEGCSVSE